MDDAAWNSLRYAGRDSVSCKSAEDSDSDAVSCFYETHRLLQSTLGEDEPSRGPFITKALLALPLLRRGNALQLVLRPQGDIYATYAKRLMLCGFRMKPKIVHQPGTVAIDTHVHTCCSPDSMADPEEMLLAAAHRGLAGIAITDHNSIEGARRAIESANKLILHKRLPVTFFVILGEEISSTDGHIIGLFLKDKIASGMSAEATIRAIHNQGGIAIAAHPLLANSLGKLANELPFDAVETENAAEKVHYALASEDDRERRTLFYSTVTKPRIGSSDAHDPQSVAECCTLLHCDATPEAVRSAILAGDVTPIAASDESEREKLRHGIPRMLAFGESLVDLSPWMRRLVHSDDVTLKLLPRPFFSLTSKF
jgi:hypothetical protein